MADATGHETTSPISVTTDIEGDRTVISVSGTKEMAIVVHSKSGERIYLPPEIEETTDDDPQTPYRSSEASPYEGIPSDSPYEGITDQSPYSSTRRPDADVGMHPTASGFRIIHPEPVTELSVLKEE